MAANLSELEAFAKRLNGVFCCQVTQTPKLIQEMLSFISRP